MSCCSSTPTFEIKLIYSHLPLILLLIFKSEIGFFVVIGYFQYCLEPHCRNHLRLLKQRELKSDWAHAQLPILPKWYGSTLKYHI